MLSATEISYSYADGDAIALDNVSVCVHAGELVAVMGGNGSGKSTLARIVSGSVEPTKGSVSIDGMPLKSHWNLVGLVRQDPQSQLVSEVVYDEIAFGLRFLDVDAQTVSQRVADVAHVCGLSHVTSAPTSRLSGGEQQRLALAGILALDPSYLVLDETTSQLDTTSRRSFLELVRQQVNNGKGVLLVTHYLAEVLQAHRVVVMQAGVLVWEGTPKELLQDAHAQELACIDPLELELCTGGSPRFDAMGGVDTVRRLCLENISVFREDVNALSEATVHVGPGITLVAGRSGSGKTTLALSASGLLLPNEGSVTLDDLPVSVGDVSLCMQRAEDQLFCDTVMEDVVYGPRNMGLSADEAQRAATKALQRLGVEEALWQRHPLRLSGGEQRRVAIAGILAMDAGVLMLDEPTAGLDGVGRKHLRDILCEVARLGTPVVVVSHDIDEWLPYARSAVLLCKGRVVFEGPAQKLMCEPGVLSAAGLCSSWERHPVDGLALSDARERPNSPLHTIPCSVKVVLLLMFTVLMFMSNSPIVVGIGFCMACVAVLLSGMHLRTGLHVVRGVAVLLAFAWVANAIVVDGSADMPLVGSVGISSAGVVRGMVSAVRIVTLAMLAMAVAHTTTASELAHTLLAPLRPLQGVGIDTSGFELSVTIALRFIPNSIDTFMRIANAQLIRLAPLRSGNVIRRLRCWVSVLIPMLVSQMHQADELANALRDRGMGRQDDMEGA